MNGGTGNDIFVFAPGFGNDTTSGLRRRNRRGQDRLDISGFGVTAGDFAGSVSGTDLGANTSINFGGLGQHHLPRGITPVGCIDRGLRIESLFIHCPGKVADADPCITATSSPTKRISWNRHLLE